MAKKKMRKPQREPTKRQMAGWELEKRRQRFLRYLGLFTVAAVLVVIAVGWYLTQYRPLSQTVIRVNDATFDMNYYIKMLRVYGRGVPANYMYAVASDVVKVIERNELARQAAAQLGITVSDQEVDTELQSHAPPLSKDYRDAVRAELLMVKLREAYFEPNVPTSAPQRYVMAMLLESESQAKEARARLESGESFTKLAAELSLDPFSKSKNGELGWQVKEVLSEVTETNVPADYAFRAEIGVVNQALTDSELWKPVGYWLIEVLGRKETGEAHVRAILLGSLDEARQVKAKLDAGGDFEALAGEFSQHPGSKEGGGDMGWLSRGMLSQAFEKYVFDSSGQKVSAPIRDDSAVTKGSYWLVKITDEDDNRKIEAADRDVLKTKAVNDWIAALWADPRNKIDDSYLDDDKRAWAVGKVIGG